MSRITSHVLDTSLGHPAAGVSITLSLRSKDGSWKELGRGVTDADGRAKELLPEGSELTVGTYRLTFDTASYFRARNTETLFPQVEVAFLVSDPKKRYHIPLLLSPFGYSTYRGS